jgi:hypothetical protein
MILLVSVPILGCGQGATTAPAAGEAAAPSVEGVWRITEVVTTGANAATITNPQPSLVIFSGGHYSWVSVNSAEPRPTFGPAKDPAKLTDAEKAARYDQWNPFTGQAGTYEIEGATITRRPTVAKNVAVMTTNPPIVEEMKLDGNNLFLVLKSAEGQPASETRTTLTRVS